MSSRFSRRRQRQPWNERLRTARRGEIWLVDFSPGRGSEQTGRRPALILQNDAGNRSPTYPNTIVLAMTSKGKAISFHIRVEPTAENGLQTSSWIKCEQILTISKTRLIGQAIGSLTSEELGQVEAAVKRSLQLP